MDEVTEATSKPKRIRLLPWILGAIALVALVVGGAAYAQSRPPRQLEFLASFHPLESRRLASDADGNDPFTDVGRHIWAITFKREEADSILAKMKRELSKQKGWKVTAPTPDYVFFEKGDTDIVFMTGKGFRDFMQMDRKTMAPNDNICAVIQVLDSNGWWADTWHWIRAHI